MKHKTLKLEFVNQTAVLEIFSFLVCRYLFLKMSLAHACCLAHSSKNNKRLTFELVYRIQSTIVMVDSLKRRKVALKAH